MRVSMLKWLYVTAQFLTLVQTSISELVDAIQPAWAHVSGNSSTTLSDWFDYEELQLTDAILANLSLPANVNASLFYFGNYSKISSAQCKTAPGDEKWPSATDWEFLNSLLGGSLIQTIPLASPCYSDWGNYDADLCAVVTANWSDWSYMQ